MAATKDVEMTDAPVDTTSDSVSEKKSKKDKKEKKEKKDKSSKKPKATEESTEPAETGEEPAETVDTTDAASDDEKPKKSSKKRKAEITEIEIDVTAPEPPSKKAKRLLKKGKTLPTKPSSDNDSDSEGETTKDGDKKAKKEKKERSPHGVWIGNLRFTVTKNELKQWLVDNSGGSITPESITRVHMPTSKAQPGQPKKEKPENRGFAYVDFDTLATKVAAIALSETEWYKRKLLIKDATSFEGRPEKKKEDEEAKKEDEPLVGGKFAGSTKIFVGNLSFDTTEDDLRAHFDKCGAIRWVKVATFEDSGKCKGYGWVNFEEGEAAQWAVKGFVKIREEIPELEDFMDEDQKAEAAAEAEAEAEAETTDKKKKQQEPEKRIKTRKWWVNQLHGRTLKIELAEDDKTRYEKRFRGKGPGAGKKGGQEGGERPQRAPYQKKEGGGQIKTAQDISVARLTGAPVAHQGKKTTFE
ncbi:hypothetical protein QBC45DRAFT_407643 [Copromyces sp. CBS 386.78]|nr:hypothetical protein QBC45DRAFT_407643 [Copromyces sp. CBS 386.78]